MKNVGRYIAIASIGAAGFAGGARAAAPTCAPPVGNPGPEFATPRPGDLAFPTFCAIPPAPKHVRSAQSFRAAVVTTRLVGAEVVRRTAPDTFSLQGTTDFAESARREVAPPPPMTLPSVANTEAFVAKAKAEAKPPRSLRHHH